MGMKTRGTNIEQLRVMTDTELRRVTVAAALDVAQTANNPNSTTYEILFAIGTLNRIEREVRMRAVAERGEDDLPASEAPAMVLP